MQKVKKIPQRQCVGCREMKDKRALIRAVKSPQGEVSLDFTGKKPGRGAYVCPNSECLKRARKSPRARARAGHGHPRERLRRNGKGDGKRWINCSI